MKKNYSALITACLLLLSMIIVTPASYGGHIHATVVATYYVDDDGTADYTKIQDAIDNASDGDVIFVYNGTYCESLLIYESSLSLIGENKENTICEEITIFASDNVNISGFTILNNSYDDDSGDVFLELCDNCNIFNNKISNSLFVEISSDNNISDNLIDGILLLVDSSSNNKVANNEINNGLFVSSSYNNNVEDNTVNGEPIVYLENQNDIVVGTAGQIVLIRCDNITIRDQELININVIETDNSQVYGNDISNPYQFEGIGLIDSDNNYFSDNNITGYHGFYLLDSDSNIITNNIICSSVKDGLHLLESNDNTISNNRIKTSDYYDGIYLSGSDRNIIHENVIDSESDSAGGIEFLHSDNCTVACNSIMNNKYGVHLIDSHDNLFYHNNFINNSDWNAYEFNSETRWYNDSLEHGNYWDDFDEPDEGAYDNDSNGVVDSPYDIENYYSQDLYPLVDPYDEVLPTVKIVKPKEDFIYLNNEEVSIFIFTFVIGPIDIKVNASDNTPITKVEIYIDDHLMAVLTKEPYNWSWNQGQLFGVYEIKAVAYDSSNNSAVDTCKLLIINMFVNTSGDGILKGNVTTDRLLFNESRSLRGATVSAELNDSSAKYIARTGWLFFNKGGYEIYLEPGFYNIVVSKDGYETQTMNNVEIKADETTVLDFNLERAD